MKLRLIEIYDVQYDNTRYSVERKASWSDRWRQISSYRDKEEGRAIFERFKRSGGEYHKRTIIDEWPSDPTAGSPE